MFKRELRPATAAAFGASAALLILLHPALHAADADSAVPRYLSYRGTLYQNGAPLNGTAELAFELYNAADAADPLWEETLTVSVYAGAFDALLGSTDDASLDALTTVVAENDDLYLAVAVITGDGAQPLASRQRFVPMPYAMWAATGASTFTAPAGLAINGATSNGLDEGGLIVRYSGLQMILDGAHIDSSGFVGFNSVSGQPVIFDQDLTVTQDEFKVHNDEPVTFGGRSALGIAEDEDIWLNPDGHFATVDFGGDTVVYSGDLAVDGALSVAGNVTLSEGSTASFGSSLSVASLTFPTDVATGGTVDLGFVRKSCSSTTCSCDNGTVPISGYGFCGHTTQMRTSYRNLFNDNQWVTSCNGSTSSVTTYVLCAKVVGD